MSEPHTLASTAALADLVALANECGISGPLSARMGFRMAASPDRLRRFATAIEAPLRAEVEALRDYIIRAHAMATGRYAQDDSEMRRRIGAMLERAIESDAVMRGFLGRGGPQADRDILTGSGSLADGAGESKPSPLREAVRIARGDHGPPTTPVRFAEGVDDSGKYAFAGPIADAEEALKALDAADAAGPREERPRCRHCGGVGYTQLDTAPGTTSCRYCEERPSGGEQNVSTTGDQ